MAQTLRQEINLIVTATASTGTNTSNEISVLDTTQYSGSPTYWFEACYSGAASNTGTIKLRDIAAATNVASLSGATSGTFVLNRVQFTPTAGAREYTLQLVGDGTRNQTPHCARIIVLQSETAITGTQTQIEMGTGNGDINSNTAVADFPGVKFWKYNSANWDGTKAFSVEVVWSTAAKNTVTITLCRTSDNAANVTVVSAGTNSTGLTRTRVSFTPVDGEIYKLRSLGSTTKSNYSLASAKIIVTQTSTITKLEPQALLLTNLDAGTGAQNYFTKYNSSEWGVGTGSNTITHLIDSDNASNSAKIVTTAAADTGSSSAATGTIQPESAAFSLIDATTYDTNVTNSTGNIKASRLKFAYVYVATSELKTIVGLAKASIKTADGLAIASVKTADGLF